MAVSMTAADGGSGIAAAAIEDSGQSSSDDTCSVDCSSELSGSDCSGNSQGCLPLGEASPLCMVAHGDTSNDLPAHDHDNDVIRFGRLAAEARATAVAQRRDSDGGKPITQRECWSALSLWKCTRNACRKRVWPVGASYVPSDTFGLVIRQDQPTWYIAQKTEAYPNVCRVLNWYLQDRLTEDQKTFVLYDHRLEQGLSMSKTS